MKLSFDPIHAIILALIIGFAVGQVVTPTFDALAEAHTYGVDGAYAFSDMQCFALALVVPPEVSAVKRMGLSKRAYMAYLIKDTEGVDRNLLNQATAYTDMVWHATDGGGKVIDLCFERAKQDAAKKNSTRV